METSCLHELVYISGKRREMNRSGLHQSPFEEEYGQDDICLPDDSDDEYHQPLSITTSITIPIGSTDGHVTSNNNYGNPLAYSLHTIQEESCEESEDDLKDSLKSNGVQHYQNGHISDHSNEDEPGSGQFSDDYSSPTDCDQFDDFKVAHNVVKARGLSTESDLESIRENLSETSDNEAGELLEDPSTLASSRLEKYFTSGLINSEAYDYPVEVDQDDDNTDDNDDNQGKWSLFLKESS